MAHPELVLCFENDDVRRILPHDGFTAGVEASVALLGCRPWFIERDYAEDCAQFRQVIPYVVLTYDGSVAVYRRARLQGDERLQDQLSIGFGGHIEIIDAGIGENGELDVLSTLRSATRRELREELQMVRPSEVHRIGAIMTDREPVSRVHLGIVERRELITRDAYPRERAIADLKWVPIPELDTASLEGWSRLVGEWMKEQANG